MPEKGFTFVQTVFMDTIEIRKKLHEFIDSVNDRKAEAIFTIFENEIDTEISRKNLVMEERQKYIAGIGTSYTPEQVKEMAMNKSKRGDLFH